MAVKNTDLPFKNDDFVVYSETDFSGPHLRLGSGLRAVQVVTVKGYIQRAAVNIFAHSTR